MIKLRVKDLLKEKGLTQKDLANKLDITEVGLSKSLSEKGNPTIATLENIANALSVSIHELFIHDGIVGIIKARGQVFEINSIEDLRNAIETIELL